MKTMVRYSLAIVGLLCLPLSAVQANLIVNPSFEDPNIPGNTWTVLPSITGWTSTIGRGIEIQDHVAGSPFDGDQHVELDSYDNSNMIQSIATVPGASYALSFAYSPRPGRAQNTNGIDVYFDGGLVASLAADGTGLADTSWTVYDLIVSASSGSTELEFIATGLSDSYGGYLDAVSLLERAVPEPASLLLLGLGLAGVGLARRRTA